ncbi:hypothetical protein BKA93DRAFT_772197 [Sparassis latifolia]
MILCKVLPLRRPVSVRNICTFSSSRGSRRARTYGSPAISDPPSDPSSSSQPSISLAHPKDPALSGSSSSVPPSSSTSDHPPSRDADQGPSASSGSYLPPPEPPVPHLPGSALPSPHHPEELTSFGPYTTPPFNTHKFFREIELWFPEPTARTLMRATRALLVDRLGRVRREALTTKDLESQAYLFKAALSELRTETTMLTRNEAAAMKTATSALRREVDTLNGRMKEDINALKHEIQMELDSRKNESKNESKQFDIIVEEVLNKSLVSLSDMRTDMEEVRWDNLRKSVAGLSGFLLVIVLAMELLKYQPKPRPPKQSSPELPTFQPELVEATQVWTP